MSAPGTSHSSELAAGIAELEEFIAEVSGGKIGAPQLRGNLVRVVLRARDGEEYLLQIQLGNYLTAPPSCSFVDAQGEPTLEAWPAYDSSGPFRPPDFICTPPTAEFYSYHSERSYQPTDGTLVNTVATIFAALHGPGYSGRAKADAPFSRRRRRRREPA